MITHDGELEKFFKNFITHFFLDLTCQEVLQSPGLVLIMISIPGPHPKIAFCPVFFIKRPNHILNTGAPRFWNVNKNTIVLV